MGRSCRIGPRSGRETQARAPADRPSIARPWTPPAARSSATPPRSASRPASTPCRSACSRWRRVRASPRRCAMSLLVVHRGLAVRVRRGDRGRRRRRGRGRAGADARRPQRDLRALARAVLRGSRLRAPLAVAPRHRRVHRDGAAPRTRRSRRARVPVHRSLVLLFWNVGTLAGALAGGGIGDPRDLGMDAMFPAAFLALLEPAAAPAGRPARRGHRRADRRSRSCADHAAPASRSWRRSARSSPPRLARRRLVAA